MHIEDLQAKVAALAEEAGLATDPFTREDDEVFTEHMEVLYRLVDRVKGRQWHKWMFIDDQVQGTGIRKGLAMELGHIVMVALLAIERLGVNGAEALHYQYRHLVNGDGKLLPGEGDR